MKRLAAVIIVLSLQIICTYAQSDVLTVTSSPVIFDEEGKTAPSFTSITLPLDSLDFYVTIEDWNSAKGDEAGVCYWVNPFFHADVLLLNMGTNQNYLLLRYIIDGKPYPVVSIYLYKSKSATIQIKNDNGELHFFYLYKSRKKDEWRWIKSVKLDVLTESDDEADIVMYSVHNPKNKPHDTLFKIQNYSL